MRRSLLLLFVALFLFSGLVIAQRDSSRNDFTNAESWFLFEEYGEAEALYQKLMKWDPDNDNLKYRIGICLLNDPYRKYESIDYLLEASKNINPNYKEGSFKERTAPPDVLFYLGSAYLVNDMIDPAIESFRRFLKIMDPEVYDEELVQAQISSCENARRLMSMPVDLDLHPMGSSVNTRYSETNPVISGNGERMVFITKQPFFDEALFIEKVNGEWTLPMSVTSMLGFDMDIYPVALNYEGTEMLLYYDDEHIGNLYTSRYEDGFWTAAVKLGENISTKYWESHACFSKDGQTLFFTSNRKGTLGGLDIYKSEKSAEGNWGLPKNLGPKINTRYNEETPYITNDGNKLYFSSYGHYNMGGYDIFYSTRNDDGTWGTPVNLGYPINSTNDDLFFHPANNGMGGYQSRISKSGDTKHDIYYMDIYSANNPRMYVVTGFLRTEDGDTDLTTLEMFVIDPENGDTIKYSIPIEKDGSFTFDLTQGDYNLSVKGEGFEDLITPLNITPASNKEGIIIENSIKLALLKTEPLVFEGEESAIKLKETVYEGTLGVPLIIPVKAKEGSVLVVKVYQDSTLVSTDTIEMENETVDLEILPLPESSLVVLEMKDSDGNIHRNRLTVNGKEPVEPKKEPLQAEPEAAISPVPAARGAAALLLTQLQEDEEIGTRGELFDYLYLQADEAGYDKSEVDELLISALAKGDVKRLYQQMLENSNDPLKKYLEGLDMEKEGINTPEELLRHLEEAAEANGFNMKDLRSAMSRAMDHPLEVEQGYDELLDHSDGIYTVEELIEVTYTELTEKELSDKEIATILEEMFPEHGELIAELTGKGSGGGFPVILGVGLGSLVLLFTLFFYRRRKREE